jgi:hypothetical protein
MNTVWIIHKGVYVFRNFILNHEMIREVKAMADAKQKRLTLQHDRRTDFRDYYEIPTEQDYTSLLTQV